MHAWPTHNFSDVHLTCSVYGSCHHGIKMNHLEDCEISLPIMDIILLEYYMEILLSWNNISSVKLRYQADLCRKQSSLSAVTLQSE
jgi:hypothetical protein